MYTKLRTVTRGSQHKIYNGNKYLVVVCEKLKNLATLFFSQLSRTADKMVSCAMWIKAHARTHVRIHKVC